MDLAQSIRDEAEQQRQAAANNVAMSGRDPVAVARAKRLSDAFGVASPLVEADPKSFEQQYSRAQTEETLKAYPYLAPYLATNPDAAAIVGKDLPAIGDITTALGMQPRGAPIKLGGPIDPFAAPRLQHTDPNLTQATPAPYVGQRSYIGASAEAGLHSLAAIPFQVLDSLFGPPSDAELAAKFKNDPDGLARAQANPGMWFRNVAKGRDLAASTAMADLSPEAQVHTDKKVFTTDTSKALYADPIAMLGGVLQSAPTSLGMLITGIMTRGAALEGEAAATAAARLAGEDITSAVTKAAIRKASIEAAGKVASRVGAVTEGGVGYYQQRDQTQQQLEQQDQSKWDASPQYKELLKTGFSPESAKLYLSATAGQEAGIGAGIVDAGTNFLGGPILARILSEGGGVIRRGLSGAAEEGVTEFIQSAGEQASSNLAVRNNVDPNQSLGEGVLEAAGQGLILGGLMGSSMAMALGHHAKKVETVLDGLHGQVVLDHIMTAAESVAMRKTSPEEFAKLINEGAKGTPATHVFVPIETIDRVLADPSIPDEEKAALSLYQDQIDDARLSQGDVVIPVGDAAAAFAGTKTWEAIKDETRVIQGGISGKDAQEQMKTLVAELEASGSAIVDEAKARAPAIEAKASVYNEAKQQVLAAGKSEKEAKTTAALLASRADALATERYGQFKDAKEAWKWMQLQIVGPDAKVSKGKAKRTGQEAVAYQEHAPLEGMPTQVEVDGKVRTFGPFGPARQAARAIAERLGIVQRPPTIFAKVDVERAARIAAEFDKMEHNPNDPETKASYRAMIDETIAQYHEIMKTGLKVEFIKGDDPYGNPRNAILDVTENNHLWVYPTESGFGSSEKDVSGNPLLEKTGIEIDGHELLANDVFRIVHDYFGHIAEGNGFRAAGEENAWRVHSAMYSDLARRAMTTETRGQNSWVNYGPHSETNRTAGPADTVYADQKIGLLPQWVSEEGRGDPSPVRVPTMDTPLFHGTPYDFEKFATNGKAVWFAEKPELAAQYASARAHRKSSGDRIIPVRVNIQNPLVVADSEQIEDPVVWAKEQFGFDLTAHGWERTGSSSLHDITRSQAFADAARAAGFDAIGVREGNGMTWGMLNPGTVFSPFGDQPVVLNQSAAVGGFEGLARHLTDDEKTGLREKMKAKILAIAESMPDAEEMAASAIAGRAKRGWYESSALAILEVFGAKDAPRFAALLAAFSPQTSVEANLYNALKIWTGWNEAGRPTERKAIVKVMGANVMGNKGVGSLLDAWINNGVRALTAENPAQVVLSGPKVNSFMDNLVGVVDEVTNDAWMANYANIDPGLLAGAKASKASGLGDIKTKGPGYKAMSAVVRKAADILTEKTGESWSPAEVQETVWSFAKTLYERRDVAGESRDMATLLRAGAVTHDDIVNTPDFVVLFSDGIYRTILEEGGYGQQAGSLGGSRRVTGVNGSESIATAPEGSGFAQADFQAFILQAANRLEAVRARRRGVDVGTAPAQGDLFSVLEDENGFPAEDIMSSEGDGTHDPMVLQQFGGQVGAYNLIGQTSQRYWALALEEEGMDPEKIWETTGWMRGADGLWRFEINDSEAELGDMPDPELDEDGLVESEHLQYVLRHPTLYRAYPSLAGMPVYAMELEDGVQGYFDGTKIVLSTKTLAVGGDKLKTLLLHEIQHAVQTIEGFNNGASADLDSLYNMGLGAAFEQQYEEYERINDGNVPGMKFDYHLTPDDLARSAAWKVYSRVLGEVEARNTETRYRLTSVGRLKSFPDMTADVPREEWLITQPVHTGMSQSSSAPPTGPRGEASFFPSGKTVVQLFAKSDFSTMLHEMSHVFLQQEFTLAKSDKASPELKADIETLKAWFEKNGGSIDENGIPDREAHELFARTGERYFREGKAPSTELRAVFKQLSDWLTGVYKSVKDLLVHGPAPITPEISDIMDRMIATSEAIRANATSPMSQEELGMTTAEYEAYVGSVNDARDAAFDTLLERMMKAVRRREGDRPRGQRANVRAEVADQVNKDPMFVALHLLRTGRWLNDSAREATPIKLNTGWLIDNYGEEVLKQLPVGLRPLHRGDGVVGDVVADLVGAPSGDALVKGLIAMKQQADALKADGNPRPLRDQMIEDETNKIMAERHGDIAMSEDQIREEAIASLNSARQGEVLATELRQLRKKNSVPGVITPYQLLREWARRKVNEGKVADAVSKSALQRYIRGFNKARSLFEDAILKGDSNEAIKQKQAQMINHALLAEGKVAADDIGVIIRRMQRYSKVKAMASIDQDYMDRVHELLEAYNFRNTSDRARAEQASFEAWAEGQRALGHEVLVPTRFRDDRVNWKDAQVGKLLELNDMVQSLVAQGKLKQKLITAQGERELAATIDDIESRILNLPDRKLPESSTGTENRPFRQALREAKNFADYRSAIGNLFNRGTVRGYVAGLIKIEGLLDNLDGVTDGTGPLNQTVLRGATDAANLYSRLLEEVLDPLIARYRSMGKQSQRLQDFVTIPELTLNVSIHPSDSEKLGKPLNIPRSKLIGLLLNTGNLSNLSKLVGGERWGNPESATDLARVRDILISHASKADLDLVQGVWDGVSKLWPHIVRVERELSGVVPEEVVPTSFDTPHGPYSGGYWPVVWDSTRSEMGKKQGEEAETALQGVGFGISTPKGHTITRTGAMAPIEWGFEHVLFGHINKVISRVAYAPWVRDTLKIVDNPRVTGAIRLRLGSEYVAAIKPWIKDQIPSNHQDIPGAKSWEKFLNQVRINMSVSVLGLSYTTGVAQTLGLGYSAGILGDSDVTAGGRWIGRGMKEMLKLQKDGALGAQEFVFARSEEMQRRAHETSREATEVFNRLHDNDTAYHRMQAAAFWHIGFIDLNMVAIPTWLGGYHKMLSQGATEQEAIDYAEKAVRLSQGSGRKKDLSAIQRGSAGQKFISMFYTPSSVFFNQQWKAVQDVRAGNYSAALAPTFWFLTMSTIGDALMAGDWPEDDDPETIAVWIARNMAFGMFYGIPFVRDLSNTAERQLTGRYATYGSTPISYGAETIGRGAGTAKKLIEGEQLEGRDVKNGVAAAGYLLGLPGNQLGKTGGYLKDVYDGKEHPDTPYDWYSGIAYGTPQAKK